jgi:hypothetical protein
MDIFGNYLPFIGFQTMPVDNDGEPTLVASAHFEADFFCLEWWGHGISIWRGDVRPRVRR